MSTPFRYLAATFGAAACSALLLACTPKEEAAAPAASTELTTEQQKFGYAVGVNVGQSLSPVKEEVDVVALKQGLDDALSGTELKMDDAEREAIHQVVAERAQTRQVAEREEQAKKAQSDGEAFLAENGKREGVITTASGLQYEILTEGTGEAPKASDSVTVHYRGTLVDGTEFDSSYSRGEPVTFPLGNVIPGWTEGLQLMKPGSKSKLFIPANLGYGGTGAGNAIPPNAALVFEVELLSVEPNVKAADPAAE